jgi:hypothetical protein
MVPFHLWLGAFIESVSKLMYTSTPRVYLYMHSNNELSSTHELSKPQKNILPSSSKRTLYPLLVRAIEP